MHKRITTCTGRFPSFHVSAPGPFSTHRAKQAPAPVLLPPPPRPFLNPATLPYGRVCIPYPLSQHPCVILQTQAYAPSGSAAAAAASMSTRLWCCYGAAAAPAPAAVARARAVPCSRRSPRSRRQRQAQHVRRAARTAAWLWRAGETGLDSEDGGVLPVCSFSCSQQQRGGGGQRRVRGRGRV